MADRREHGWVIARLKAHAAGLLDEAGERRLREHLAGCAECREIAAVALDPPALEDAAHVPASVLAQWGLLDADTFEARMWRSHLERCDECRDALHVLARARGAKTPAAGTATAAPSPPVASRGAGGARRATWLVGGWAAVASIVAVALLCRDLVMPHPPAPVSQGPPATPTTILRAGPLVSLTSPARGSTETDVTTVWIEEQDRAVRFVVEPLSGVAPDSPVRVELADPSGRRLAGRTLPHRETVNPGEGVVIPLHRALLMLPEPLTLRVTGPALPRSGAAPESAAYRLRFRIRS